ncbi:MAG: hypothetical protein GX761_11980 [Gammaproteobacteria bacterium]|nr:hypothetical protein [Gammaproteobacteria bacterium]
MADGSHAFNFPPPQVSRLRPGEIVVDLFAGGGGASEALKQALGVDPHLAYNHDADAIGMHSANHPLTDHHREDIWHADPVKDVAGRPVGWFHASPDCTHFSQAKGGQPRNRKIRSLSWVVLKWTGQLAKVGLAPRILSLENVWQILKWGPLIAKRCRETGRVVTLDMVPLLDEAGRPVKRRGKVVMVNRVADPGERVPVEKQALVPDPRYAGRTWRQFVRSLEALGYVVEWRRLRACDYGAGTSRERLFLLARRDGEPIRWPEPTHGPGRPQPYVTAADCLDFTDRGISIFDRPRPLAEATMRRIARGVVRHVLEAEEPFFITEFANASNGRTWSGNEPLRTQCAGVKGGHFAAVVPTLVQTGYGERSGQQPRVPDIGAPLGTVVAGGVKHALVSAFLEQANGGGPNGNPARARSAREPVSAITASGSQQRLVTAHLATLRNNMHGAPATAPLATIAAGGEHHGVVECTLTPEAEAGALRVAAFLINYYGNGTARELRDPLDTVTTRDRLALVTVTILGTPYVIVDIGLRMLRPHELYRAQGFPPGYIHDRTADGRPLTITAQVRMVGNSVSPPPLCALANANLDPVHADMGQAA